MTNLILDQVNTIIHTMRKYERHINTLSFSVSSKGFNSGMLIKISLKKSTVKGPKGLHRTSWKVLLIAIYWKKYIYVYEDILLPCLKLMLEPFFTLQSGTFTERHIPSRERMKCTQETGVLFKFYLEYFPPLFPFSLKASHQGKIQIAEKVSKRVSNYR